MAYLTQQQAFDLAMENHSAGRLKEAEALYRQLLALEPGNSDVMNLLGLLEYHCGNLQPALELMQRSVAVNPGVARYYLNLATVLIDLGGLEEAAAASQKAIALEPRSHLAYYNLGLARQRQREDAAAMAAYREALRLDPSYRLARLNLGGVYHYQVLHAVPGSRLLLLCPEGSPRARLETFFRASGIAADRVELVASQPRLDYLGLYHRIDIALDPFPYNGITTTCDALWMGVPVLTLPGRTPASRAGLSLLSAAHLPDFIAHSEDEYLATAVALASDLPHLAALRLGLRERVQSSPLGDATRFAREMEAAYRQMWERWCAQSE